MPANIILIMADQFRGDCIHYDGNGAIYTPYLDELASEGCFFKRGYSPSPTCVPARACLVTGKKAARTGFFSNNFETDWDFSGTMMETLRDSGYQTINVGKNHFHPQRLKLGFETNVLYETKADEAGLLSDYHQWLQEKCGDSDLDTARRFNCNGFPVMPWTADPDLHPNCWTAAEAIRQMKMRDPTRPFYMQISFHRPHPPLDPPQYMLDMYRDAAIPGPSIGDWAPVFSEDTNSIFPFEGRINTEYLKLAKRAYYAQISHIDEQIGRIVHYLRSTQLYQDTMVVFTADHGEMMGDHNMFRKGPFLEGSVRIPFIVKFPQGENARFNRQRSSLPVSLLDLFPTFAACAGIKAPEGLDGMDIARLLAEPESRVTVMSENYRNEKTMVTGGICVVGRRYKYIWNSVKGEELFFDLENDPHEMHDFIKEASLQEEIKRMRRQVIEEYRSRPYDDMLTENGSLKSGRVLPSYRTPQD